MFKEKRSIEISFLKISEFSANASSVFFFIWKGWLGDIGCVPQVRIVVRQGNMRGRKFISVVSFKSRYWELEPLLQWRRRERQETAVYSINQGENNYERIDVIDKNLLWTDKVYFQEKELCFWARVWYEQFKSENK